MSKPKVSIVLPIHEMENGAYFLWRAIQSIMCQSFKDYEIIITQEGKMAENTNAGIKKARGKIIKILYMDDYFSNEHSLQEIVDAFRGGWLVTGCFHDDGSNRFLNPHHPYYNSDIKYGNNTIGSPSVLAFENKDPLLFDEKLSWLLDCELYTRLHARYGLPTYLSTMNVTLGIGKHQMSNILTDEDKQEEYDYLTKIKA